MIGRFAALFSLLLSFPAVAWDLDVLMRNLALQKGGHARFVETKTLAILDKPVISSGELLYAPPARLEKRTFQPKPEILVLDGDLVSIERGKQKISFRLSEQPLAQAFVDSLRGTLAGDKQTLEKNYTLKLSGRPERWTLDLYPSEQRIAAIVLRITLSGTGNRLYWIRYLQADGDHSEMTIEPLKDK